MTKILKAIPTTYHGIEFRSKLEAKYAQAFDKLGIVWEYESHGFRFDDGTCYCPDFYMPEIDTYFEVKGALDAASDLKLGLLANEKNFVVIGNSKGDMHRVYPSETARPTEYSECTISVCDDCRKLYFRDLYLAWDCPCGRSGEGFAPITGDDWDYNLFSLVGW